MSDLKDYAIMPSSDYQAICDAVREKTGSTELLKSGEVAAAIEGISSGGGTGNGTFDSYSSKYVNFYDYDGTMLYSYTLTEIQEMTKLPELPSHSGLICQGWNYDLDTIKSLGRATDVGAMYITDDGKTRLCIEIPSNIDIDVPLYFSQTVSNGVTIDWGDDSGEETVSGTGNVSITHTYSNVGRYIISLNVSDGCTLGFGYGLGLFNNLSSTGDLNGITRCNGLIRQVYIGKNIPSITARAFAQCMKLNRITIPYGVTSICTRAFYSCQQLISATIPNSTTALGSGTFERCSDIVSVSLPDSIATMALGDSSIPSTSAVKTFGWCRSLKRMILPSKITWISSVCPYCYSLKSAILPDGLNTMYSQDFYYCYALEDIVIPSGVTSIHSYTFQYCYQLKSIALPSGLSSIPSFYNCSDLESIIFPSGFTGYILSETFYNTSIDSIEIPEGVMVIGSKAFYGCRLLTYVKIPSTISDSTNTYDIGDSAFYNCTGMKVYDFTSCISVPTISSATFVGIPSDCEIRVPAALYDEWIAAENWSTYASQIVAI